MTLTRRRLLILAASTALAGALPAYGADSIRVSGHAFGTSWHMRLRGAGDLDGLAEGIAEVLSRIDRAMSPFRPDSEISGFNRSSAGWQAASPDFAMVTAAALRVAALTGGAFDPSVGPDVGRYGFGPIHGERVGSFADFAVRDLAIWKSNNQLTLDLCGIAKGYALDLMVDQALAAGFEDFVIELGGEVFAQGSDIGGLPWQVGISDPLGDGLHAIVDTKGRALATSGDAVNAYAVGGRRYSHIIDPGTDEPLVNAVASVSVFADTAMTADALATGLMVMGAARGIDFADRFDLAALFLTRTPEGIEHIASRAYDKHRLD